MSRSQMRALGKVDQAPESRQSPIIAPEPAQKYPRQSPWLASQRAFGNRALGRCLQAHLKVGTSQDPYEREADRVAEQVMAMPEPSVQKHAKVHVSSPKASALQTKLAINEPDDEYEREADRVAEQVVRESEPAIGRSLSCPACDVSAPKVISERDSLQSSNGSLLRCLTDGATGQAGGRPLDAGTRAFFQPRLGYNLGSVRVHADGDAAERAYVLGARAYTYGRNIVFGAGEYAPSTEQGKHLLAHELVHVIQQEGHGAASPVAADRQSATNEYAGTAGPSTSRVRHPISAAGGSRIQRSLSIPATDPAISLFLNALTRLTGRQVSATGGNLTLGAPTRSTSGSSATVTDYVQRALSASRAYTLRSGTTTPRGATVRGVRWETAASGGGVTITLNTGDIGTFTWTVDELLSEGLVNAVAANDRTSQTFPATSGGVNLDVLLATQLPFSNRALLQTAMRLIKQRVPAVASDPQLEVEVETALLGASGITLSEVLRGLETSTAYRIVQSISGNRVRATYIDPRRRPGTGEHQTLPRRGVTFLAGPGRGTPRGAPLPGATPCSTAVIREITGHLVTSRRYITNAIAHLASGTSINPALIAHFGRTGPANRTVIAANFRLIHSEMELARHGWMCTRRGMGQGCDRPGITGRAAIALPDVQLCIERRAPYVPRMTTVLHEVVHASGIGTLPAGREVYAWQGSAYPGSDPLHNADSYAQFAAAVGRHAAPAPAPAPRPAPAPAPTLAPTSVQTSWDRARLERTLRGSTAELHQEIAEDFRRRHHLPAGGVDELGNRVGPSDPQIIYGALWLQPSTLAELAGVTPWELAHTPVTRLSAPTGSPQPATGPQYVDYIRARGLIRNLHRFHNLTYDYERNFAPVGMEPNTAQLGILDLNLNQVLSTFNVRALVSGPGGRGLPSAPRGTTPTLAGRVRLVNSLGDFAGKRYQLERWAGANRLLNAPTADLDTVVGRLWADSNVGVPAASNARKTIPERVAAVWHQTAMQAFLEPAFYFPREDKIYLSHHVNLATPGGVETARHETVHLLGGREITRQAFIREFGTNWRRYWRPFEEGIVELITVASRVPGQTPPAGGRSGVASGYQAYSRQVQQLIASPGMSRNDVLRAFFTGRIPSAMFRRWRQIIDAP